MLRKNRKKNEIRKTRIELNYLDMIPASTLIEQGNTIVLVNSTVNDSVPSFLKGSGRGWITAQYAMLPRSTSSRVDRERKYISGRTYEIQRFIGRCLRQAFDTTQIGERTVLIDCDVIQADGGTRTASITAGFVSLYEILREMKEMDEIKKIPLKNWIAAISTGLINNEIYLDLDYNEDAQAGIDSNIVLNSEGKIVEFQSFSEGELLSMERLNQMINIARDGIKDLIDIQRDVLSIE